MTGSPATVRGVPRKPPPVARPIHGLERAAAALAGEGEAPTADGSSPPNLTADTLSQGGMAGLAVDYDSEEDDSA